MIRDLVKKYIKKLLVQFHSYDNAIKKNYLPRSHYAYCCYQGAVLAKKLKIKRISVIEFGCAGGTGLLAIEKITEKVEQLTGIQFDIFGFDSGIGLPKPLDYRDLPYIWKEGFFRMNKKKLTKQLKKSTIVFGEVNETIEKFIQKYSPSPIAAIFHDFDYYSSTLNSFKFITQENQKFFLPRVFNYFDDIIGGETELYNEFVGELLAISEFNNDNKSIKFAKAQNLITKKNQFVWYHQIRILHFFNHPLYNEFIGNSNLQLEI